MTTTTTRMMDCLCEHFRSRAHDNLHSRQSANGHGRVNLDAVEEYRAAPHPRPARAKPCPRGGEDLATPWHTCVCVRVNASPPTLQSKVQTSLPSLPRRIPALPSKQGRRPRVPAHVAMTSPSGKIMPTFETSQKGRLVWTMDLHKAFVVAVDNLGLEHARPQAILRLMTGQGQYMNGLTSEHIKSHLQKYRQNQRRHNTDGKTASEGVEGRTACFDDKRDRWMISKSSFGSKSLSDTCANAMIKTTSTPRLVWTNDLHACFVQAVQTLGVDTCRPQVVQRLMNVDGLTTEHIKSHLQKYRASLRQQEARSDASAPRKHKWHNRNLPNTCQRTPVDPNFEVPGAAESKNENHPKGRKATTSFASNKRPRSSQGCIRRVNTDSGDSVSGTLPLPNATQASANPMFFGIPDESVAEWLVNLRHTERRYV